MMTFAIANQKGGVGKTTLARNLGFYAIDRGLRVLLVDLDPQKNLTKTWRARREAVVGDSGEGVDCLMASDLFTDRPSGLPLQCGAGAALIPADRQLVDVASRPLNELALPGEALHRMRESYDICIIDTAPTLGNPLYAALIAADCVVCPCTMDQDAIDGLGDLFDDIARVRQLEWNAELETLGLLPNRVNVRRAFDRRALTELRDALGELVLDAVLYDRAATQYAKDRPVWRVRSGESQIRAALEMKATCGTILDRARQAVRGRV